MEQYLQTFQLKIVMSINLHPLGCQILDLSLGEQKVLYNLTQITRFILVAVLKIALVFYDSFAYYGRSAACEDVVILSFYTVFFFF